MSNNDHGNATTPDLVFCAPAVGIIIRIRFDTILCFVRNASKFNHVVPVVDEVPVQGWSGDKLLVVTVTVTN